MNGQRNRTAASATGALWVGIGLIVAGGVLLVLAIGLDGAGLVGGFVQGAAIGAMIVGGYVWGYANGARRTPPRGEWLPSRGTPE